MAIGVIGLGNIGGAIAANLVADGNEVVVHDVDAAADDGDHRGHGRAGRRVGGAARPTSRCCRCRRPTSSPTWPPRGPAAAAPGAILVDLSTNSPAVVRELGERLAGSGHHLVEAPLTGGAIGAEKRMLVFMVGGDDEPVARVLPGARAARARHVPRRRARSRQHDEAAQQPHRLHDDVGQPRGPGLGHQGGDRGPEGRGDPAHGRGVELLHRPPGRDDRRAGPADAVRAGAGRQGRRPHRRDRATRSASPTPVGGGRARASSTARSRRASAAPTGASSSPSPSSRPTWRCAGTPS